MERVKRVVSLMLCLVMVFGLLPMSVFATDVETSASNEEVYVLVSSITEEGEYLIVSANEATDGANMLAAPSSGSKVENLGAVVETGVTADGESIVYIAGAAENAVWTATANGSNWKLFNGETGRYLRYSNGLKAATSSTSWTADEDALYFAQTAMGETTNNYVRFKNAWGTQNSAAAVYVYQKQAVAFAEAEAPVENETVVEDEIIDEEIIDEEIVNDEAVTVGDDGTLEDSITVSTTTTKNIYVLTDSVTAGNKYIIASGNTAGSAYALDGDSTGTTVTILNTDGVTYIDAGSPDNNVIVWTASSGLKFQNNLSDQYLSRSSGNVSFVDSSGSASSWTYSSNTLKTGTRYLQCSDGKWSASYSSSKVYLYQYKENQNFVTNATYTVAVANPTITVAENGTAQINAVLQQNGADTTTALTYQVVSGDISVSDTGLITARSAGEAQVKVTCTVDGKTIGKIVNVTVLKPGYNVEITNAGAVVTGTISQKNVKAGTTLELGTQILMVLGTGATEIVNKPDGAKLEWSIPAEYAHIATVNQNGVVTFTGVDGEFEVWVNLTVDGESCSDKVTISATTTSYVVPSDGAVDFPQYPNEGAIRYDKTAMAVGNFSSTGITKMELSMTGVPYTTGSEIDVVIMLDQSTSMTDARISATQAATKVFIQSIVQNTDGTYNGNRVYVGYFNGNNTYDITDAQNIGGKLASVDSDAELNALFDDLMDEFDGSPTSTGTYYPMALSNSRTILTNAKTDGIGNNRQQFMVFMSDGEPTRYQTAENSYISSTSSMFTNAGARDTDYYYEYYSTQMKAVDNVTVYSVGLGLSKSSAEIMLNDISGPAGETQDTQPDKKGTSTQSKLNKYFFSVADANAAADMQKVFSGIAKSIMQAATNVTVEDQITGDYTMIFGLPTGEVDIGGDAASQEFYIEFLKYALDEEEHQRTDDVTSMVKLYLGVKDGKYYAASDAAGTDYAAPVFEQKALGDKGTLYYWTTDASKSDSGISVASNGTTYYYVSYGLESGYNMTSGAYAAGTVNEHNMSTDLIIATPYFVYNANTKMLYWTVDKLDSYEYVLNYFLYLDNSATEVGQLGVEKPAGTYPTNDHAYITYTNFLQHDCRQEFPKPQMTWNGAQASYVFYLVNAAGEPINRSGQKVDFANATFVTDVFTEAVIWNKGDDAGNAQLDVNWLASEKLPTDYKIYDEQAQYILSVYENADGSTIKDQFTIAGGTAAEISASLNSRLNLTTTAAGVSTSTTKVYNTKAGTKYTAYKTYTSSDKDMAGFDFANTTVAFAVVWQPKLVADTVVVDFGLDVLIDVVENDLVKNKIDGIGASSGVFGKVEMNTGIADVSKLGMSDLTIDGNTIHIENEKQIRFQQGDMKFEQPVTFYYQSEVDFYEQSQPKEGFMYSSVTVIPATTIYYEDSFVTLQSYTWDYTSNGWTETENVDGAVNVWSQEGTTINATQAQDRPGSVSLTGALDANNIYGYDQAYDNCATFSMGSAKKAHVDYDNRGTATFDFYGTGFDIFAVTSSETGYASVKVYAVDNAGNAAATPVKSIGVDTYYSYELAECYVTYAFDGENWNKVGCVRCEGVTIEAEKFNKPETPKEGDTYVVKQDALMPVDEAKECGTLYQVPVIKAEGLAYGHYRAVLTVQYSAAYDHNQVNKDGAYDFYLDAIRIYDPAGKDNTVANDAYEKDGELAPSYQEIRNNLIAANSFTAGAAQANGFMFIDGVSGNVAMADYQKIGPNNEVYLQKGQSIAFRIAAPTKTGMGLQNIHIGAKSADGGEVEFSIANVISYEKAAQSELVGQKTFNLKTATDMYYDLTEWKNGVIVITNESESILSLTNLKYTYYKADDHASVVEEVEEVVEAYAYMTAADVEMVLRVLNAPAVNETVPTEPEVTEPETTAPGSTTGESTVKTIIGLIGKLLGKIFG